MTKKINKGILLLIALSITFILSCIKEKEYDYFIGNPTLSLTTNLQSAQFGDSVSFTAQVADNEIALSTLKAQLYFTDDVVSETTIRTDHNGTYSGKIYVPFYKDIPNGKATLKFTLQNISKKAIEQEVELNIVRPDYPYLNLITATKTYKMLKVAANTYAANENFPFSVKGYIEAPKLGTQGNTIHFGWVNNTISLGSTAEIPFSNSTSGQYSIQFNTLTYAASPFIIAYAINGNVLNRIDDKHFKTEINVNTNDPINIDGIEDLNSWWIDSDFIKKDASGKLTFNALSGKYRITADFDRKYFIIEPMSGSNLATLNADGTGAIWIIGEGIGKPNVADNQVGWNTDKALALAPLGNKKYQITVVANETIKSDNINFKFFHQKNWGGEFGGGDISTSSDLIFIGNGTNGRDGGNLGIQAGKTLEKGKTYVFTIDLSAGNNKAVLNVN